MENIVLVDGFWADGSCCGEIIPTLLAEGFEVIAVQNPLTSFADDVAATKRALHRIEGEGKCVLVRHSWGGVVITAAGNDERGAGLVYINELQAEWRCVYCGKDVRPEDLKTVANTDCSSSS